MIPPQSKRAHRQERPSANHTTAASAPAIGDCSPCRVCQALTTTGRSGICRNCAIDRAYADALEARQNHRADGDVEARALTRARREYPERTAAWRQEMRRIRDLRRAWWKGPQ